MKRTSSLFQNLQQIFFPCKAASAFLAKFWAFSYKNAEHDKVWSQLIFHCLGILILLCLPELYSLNTCKHNICYKCKHATACPYLALPEHQSGPRCGSAPLLSGSAQRSPSSPTTSCSEHNAEHQLCGQEKAAQLFRAGEHQMLQGTWSCRELWVVSTRHLLGKLGILLRTIWSPLVTNSSFPLML